MRVYAKVDRGVLKFQIRRKGKIYGWLTLDGLVRWMENQKPTAAATVVSFTKKSL
ncbi:hypothetical protein [Thermoactinomyces sp. CICC 10521]|uniref:hypothetical protein n=1 Tax=Thermoactinomyces sp. CICC 10521 TaxID=2767426 RepID=UPI0018DE8D4B|nr:hypothetical protein [Thermoactinomyces sp. CICC 10521]MBH8609133.1 hypothetical protein [Thermoactinomyces sp. CICC 10521]